MADDNQQIPSKAIRGIDGSGSFSGLWIEWSHSSGAWYAQISIYEGSVSESNLVFPQTFHISNQNGEPINDYTWTGAVYGHTYVVGLKYLPESGSEWTESDETYETVTYTGGNPPPPNPFGDTTFKIRDYDDSGVQFDYIGHDWTTFITDGYEAGATGLKVYIKKSSESEYTQIYARFENRTTTGTDGDFDWESGVYNSGYYEGWGWLNFTNLEPLTTYKIYAYVQKDSDCYPVRDLTEIEWTTTSVPIAKLPTPTNLSVTGISESTSTLNWSEVTNASGYTVRWRKEGAATWNSQDVDA